jgi:hypothetical protein
MSEWSYTTPDTNSIIGVTVYDFTVSSGALYNADTGLVKTNEYLECSSISLKANG